MKHITSSVAFVPVRKEASHRSEMVSQLLFGETAQILKTEKEWLFIRTSFDDYAGWIESDAVIELADNDGNGKRNILSEPLTAVQLNGHSLWLPGGSEVIAQSNSNKFKWAGKSYTLQRNTASEKKSDLIQTALKYLHAPYLWGGRTVLGIDCSGFTQIVCKIHGIALPRDAGDQVKTGKEIPQSAMEKGDLVFFENENSKITHVGFYYGDNRILHASKKVRIDRLDEKGIFNEESERYTHNYHSVRRIK